VSGLQGAHPSSADRVTAPHHEGDRDDDAREPRRSPLRRILIAVAVLVVLCAILWLTPLRQVLEPSRLVAVAQPYRTHPLTPLVLIVAFSLLSSAMLPINILIAATGLAFGPWLGGAYALLATLSAAVVHYFAGVHLGAEAVERFAGPRAKRVRGHLVRRGFWAVAVTHVFPVAPFVVMNLLAGASGIRFRDYFLGIAIAMTPGILIVAGLGGQIARIFS
jgi:phospholipase D1/2